MPDDVGFGARIKLYGQRPGFRSPCSAGPVFSNDAVGFPRQTAPEGIIGFDGLTGIEALENQSLQFIRRSFEVGNSCSLHCGEGGINHSYLQFPDDEVRDHLEVPDILCKDLTAMMQCGSPDQQIREGNDNASQCQLAGDCAGTLRDFICGCMVMAARSSARNVCRLCRLASVPARSIPCESSTIVTTDTPARASPHTR